MPSAFFSACNCHIGVLMTGGTAQQGTAQQDTSRLSAKGGESRQGVALPWCSLCLVLVEEV